MYDAIKMMESKMSLESVLRSRIIAEQEILAIKLQNLKEKFHNNQDDCKELDDISISPITEKEEIKISTLIEYLDKLGLGLEIKTFPKNNTNMTEDEILLRI